VTPSVLPLSTDATPSHLRLGNGRRCYHPPTGSPCPVPPLSLQSPVIPDTGHPVQSVSCIRVSNCCLRGRTVMAVTSATFFVGSSQCLTDTVSLNQYSACLVSRHSQLGTSPARYLQQEGRRGVVSLASMLSLIVAFIWADWAFIWALNSYLLRATRARRLQCGVPRGSGAGVPPLHTLLELLCQGLLWASRALSFSASSRALSTLHSASIASRYSRLQISCSEEWGGGGTLTESCSLFIPG